MAGQDITSVEQLLDRNLKALNAQDIEGILANQQPDAELVNPGGLTLHGHEQVRQVTEALWTAFPDAAFSFAGQVLTEDAAAVELLFIGTNTGPLATPNGVIPPTGRRVTLRSASILRFKDGLIASEHAYPDQLDFMTQLGLMPPAPGSPAIADGRLCMGPILAGGRCECPRQESDLRTRFRKQIEVWVRSEIGEIRSELSGRICFTQIKRGFLPPRHGPPPYRPVLAPVSGARRVFWDLADDSPEAVSWMPSSLTGPRLNLRAKPQQGAALS